MKKFEPDSYRIAGCCCTAPGTLRKLGILCSGRSLGRNFCLLTQITEVD